MSNSIADIAAELYEENDGYTSVAAISYWLRNHLGELNNLIYTDFYIVESTQEPSPDIEDGEKAILKLLYQLYYYDRQIRANLGVGGISSALEVSSDGATVRRASKTEAAKTFLQAKGGATAALNQLVYAYQIKGSTPRQISGDDDVAASTQSHKYNPRNRSNDY